MSIKFCLLLTFLVALLTGYFYIRALIKEDYEPVFKRFNSAIQDDKEDIKAYELKYESLTNEISQLRENIKSEKNFVNNLNENLLDIEHTYSKVSQINTTRSQELSDLKKISESQLNELDFYDSLVDKDALTNVMKENTAIQKEIDTLKENISKENATYKKLDDDIIMQKSVISELEKIIVQKSEELDSNKTKSKTFKENILKTNKALALQEEISALKKKIASYKEEILKFKD